MMSSLGRLPDTMHKVSLAPSPEVLTMTAHSNFQLGPSLLQPKSQCLAQCMVYSRHSQPVEGMNGCMSWEIPTPNLLLSGSGKSEGPS